MFFYHTYISFKPAVNGMVMMTNHSCPYDCGAELSSFFSQNFALIVLCS